MLRPEPNVRGSSPEMNLYQLNEPVRRTRKPLSPRRRRAKVAFTSGRYSRTGGLWRAVEHHMLVSRRICGCNSIEQGQYQGRLSPHWPFRWLAPSPRERIDALSRSARPKEGSDQNRPITIPFVPISGICGRDHCAIDGRVQGAINFLHLFQGPIRARYPTFLLNEGPEAGACVGRKFVFGQPLQESCDSNRRIRPNHIVVTDQMAQTF